MPASPARRVNYFERQFIRLPELSDEQAYHLSLRRRHNISHHTSGIVLGLEMVRENDVCAIRPGLAIDGYGRELLLLNRKVIDGSMFEQYGTNRLDFWLEYQLELADDRTAPVECGGGDPRRRYRAIERPEITPVRAGAARIDPRRPPGVPAEELDETLMPGTPDDPAKRWPVYLGRVARQFDASGNPTFLIDTSDRIYAGLNAALIDHPGNPSRIELGLRPDYADTRRIDDQEYEYSADSDRDFALFVPPTTPPTPGSTTTLEPVIAVEGAATAIRGTVTVHGNVVLDGSSLQFQGSAGVTPNTGGDPALYRNGDELRIDLGDLGSGVRKLVLGVTKDDKFQPALEISFPLEPTPGGVPKPLVTIHGDLRIEGNIESTDVRTRTITPEAMAILTGMVQAGMAAGGN